MMKKKGRTQCRELPLCAGSGEKGVSGKPYPRLCNARRPRLEPGTFRSQVVRLYRLHQARPSWTTRLSIKKFPLYLPSSPIACVYAFRLSTIMLHLMQLYMNRSLITSYKQFRFRIQKEINLDSSV